MNFNEFTGSMYLLSNTSNELEECNVELGNGKWAFHLVYYGPLSP